jgi:hypothetical protein
MLGMQHQVTFHNFVKYIIFIMLKHSVKVFKVVLIIFSTLKLG